MKTSQNKKFYFITIAILLVLSAYPLINGVRMAYISIVNGVLQPDEYARYVIPYAAICLSLIFYALFEPLLAKLKKAAFPVGYLLTIGVFLTAEMFFENMQIYVTGMALIDTATLTTSETAAGTTADVWQAALCAVSPDMMGQSLTYVSTQGQIYVVDNSAYKIHYYMISLIMITMVSALIYGIAKMYRTAEEQTAHNLKKPLFMRGIATATLIALCVFANTTAFFRAPAPIQTPLASFLTGTFFVFLGAAAGVYTGSFLLEKKRRTGVRIPVIIAVLTTVLMYIGEAMMMGGNLYRFGTGWFYTGLPVITVSVADLLVIFFAGFLTYFTLGVARRRKKWPGKRTLCASIVLCVLIALAGPVIAAVTPDKVDEGIIGCYVFKRNVYTNPLSSFIAAGSLPYVYGFDDDVYIHAGMGTIGIKTYDIDYYKAPIDIDELGSRILSSDPPPGSFTGEQSFSPPDLSQYYERYLLAVITENDRPAYALYGMDDELWLVEFNNFAGIYTIYEIVRTEDTTLEDLRRAVTYYETSRPVPLDPPGPGLEFYENQMTVRDVYALARIGEDLKLDDFAPYCYWLTGADFRQRLYEVAGGDTVFVRESGGAVTASELLSRRAVDAAQTIDLREGFEAVAEYYNPFKLFMNISVLREQSMTQDRELFYEDDTNTESRYYLDGGGVDSVYVLLDGDERMTAVEALRWHRLTIEDLIAGGLKGVTMMPIDNPHGGRFTHISGLQTFRLNEEPFYPSKTFMYAVFDSVTDGEETTVTMRAYFSIVEILQFFDLYGYSSEAELLRGSINTENILSIARGIYADSEALRELGVNVNLLWPDSPSTPVWFTLTTVPE